MSLTFAEIVEAVNQITPEQLIEPEYRAGIFDTIVGVMSDELRRFCTYRLRIINEISDLIRQAEE